MENRNYYVYRHTIKATNKVFYIGRSRVKDFKRAFNLFCTQRNKSWCETRGSHEVVVEILATNMNEADSGELEEFLILEYGRLDLGTGILTNKCNGGATSKGMKRTDEYCQKLSTVMKGKYTGEKNPFYKKQHSQESLDKMRKPRESLKDGGHFRSKVVIDILTSETYLNIRIASQAVGIKYSTLRSYLRGANYNKTSLIYLDVVNRLNKIN